MARHDVGPDGYPGKPLFIVTPGAGEDDGMVVALVSDAAFKRTDVVDLDARDIADKQFFTDGLRRPVPFCPQGMFPLAVFPNPRQRCRE